MLPTPGALSTQSSPPIRLTSRSQIASVPGRFHRSGASSALSAAMNRDSSAGCTRCMNPSPRIPGNSAGRSRKPTQARKSPRVIPPLAANTPRRPLSPYRGKLKCCLTSASTLSTPRSNCCCAAASMLRCCQTTHKPVAAKPSTCAAMLIAMAAVTVLLAECVRTGAAGRARAGHAAPIDGWTRQQRQQCRAQGHLA